MNYKVPFIRPCYTRFWKSHKQEIRQAIEGCFDRGDLTLRKDVWDLEESIANFVGTKYAVGVNSGTDALFLSLLALGIGKGDEVITVSNTFIATIQAIVHTGATPVLIDVNTDEQMNVFRLEDAITEHTKAVIPVHYTGAIVDMGFLMKVAKKYKLHVVEDACQALGATQDGKKAGSFGILGCFSFNTAKLLGGLCDGGMVVTNDRNLYEKICLLRNHWNVHQLSVDRNDYPQPKKMAWAWKSRLSNVNAAFLNIKFKYLPWMIRRRKEIAEKYIDAFKDLLVGKPENVDGRIWQEFHVRVKDRDKFAAFLKKKGIETLTRDVVPNHLMEGLKLSHFHLPVTEELARSVIRIPLHEYLTDIEIGHVIKSIKEYYAQRNKGFHKRTKTKAFFKK